MPLRRPARRLALALVPSLLVAVSSAPTASAENWPQWRGPHLNGSSDESHLPDSLDKDKTLRWATAMPGASNATPVVWGEKVFVSSLEAESKKLLAMAVNRADGKILWKKEIGYGPQAKGANSMASPSPITDGKHVWFFYGTGDLACFDLDGNPVWARNIQKDFGPFNIQWIYASSPLLYGGKLYVPVLHRDLPTSDGKPAESYLLALDPETGKDLWRVIRPTDAVGESREWYGTPMPVEVNGHSEIVLFGGDHATGHDAATGKELWRFGDYNPKKINHWRTVPSATIADGLVILCPPKRGAPVFAVKPGGSGDVTTTQLAWQNKDVSSDVCVPLFYHGLLYILDDYKKAVLCLNPKDGTVKWTAALGGKSVFRASPTGADGKIYCVNEAAEVSVVSADDGKVLSHTALGQKSDRGEATRASIVEADGQVFVRTADMLYAFGQK